MQEMDNKGHTFGQEESTSRLTSYVSLSVQIIDVNMSTIDFSGAMGDQISPGLKLHFSSCL